MGLNKLLTLSLLALRLLAPEVAAAVTATLAMVAWPLIALAGR